MVTAVPQSANAPGRRSRAKVGLRYQNRDQDVRYTTYNWGMLSEVWSGTRPVNFGDTSGDGQQIRYDFPNFFRGETPAPQERTGGFAGSRSVGAAH